jgi:hypothetical protein
VSAPAGSREPDVESSRAVGDPFAIEQDDDTEGRILARGGVLVRAENNRSALNLDVSHTAAVDTSRLPYYYYQFSYHT